MSSRLGPMTTTFSTPAHPVSPILWSGCTTGTCNTKLRHASTAESSTILHVGPPPETNPNLKLHPRSMVVVSTPQDLYAYLALPQPAHRLVRIRAPTPPHCQHLQHLRPLPSLLRHSFHRIQPKRRHSFLTVFQTFPFNIRYPRRRRPLDVAPCMLFFLHICRLLPH